MKISKPDLQLASKEFNNSIAWTIFRAAMADQMERLSEMVYNPGTTSEDLVKAQQYGAAVMALHGYMNRFASLGTMDTHEFNHVVAEMGIHLLTDETESSDGA